MLRVLAPSSPWCYCVHVPSASSGHWSFLRPQSLEFGSGEKLYCSPIAQFRVGRPFLGIPENTATVGSFLPFVKLRSAVCTGSSHPIISGANLSSACRSAPHMGHTEQSDRAGEAKIRSVSHSPLCKVVPIQQ